MNKVSGPSHRTIWVDLLLYPGHTLPTAAGPVLVGVALAFHDGIFAFWPALAGFVASWLIHVGGVFTDNYQLLTKHGDIREHPELNEAMENGTLTRFGLLAAIFGCFLVAALTGLYLVPVGGWPVVVIAVIGVLSSLVYVAGPAPATRYGLADPLFFVMFGVFAEAATYYIQAAAYATPADWLSGDWWNVVRALPLSAFVVGLPVGGLITNVMVIDDMRDHEFDAMKKWRTGTVLFGIGWSRIEFVAFTVFAYLAPLCFWQFLGFDAWVLLPLLTAPFAYRIVVVICTYRRREDLFRMTPRTATLSLVYAALLGIGVALSAT